MMGHNMATTGYKWKWWLQHVFAGHVVILTLIIGVSV